MGRRVESESESLRRNQMKKLDVEKWTDRVTFVLMLTLSVRQAICANYMAMAGWFCAALWIVIAMIRRKDRDAW